MSLTLEELSNAIRNSIDDEMEEEIAISMAEHALGFFGYQDRIIDNALEPEDRNLFYMFEDYNLLTTESEETTLWDGRDWRIHYWKFKQDVEALKSSGLTRKPATEEDMSAIYNDVFAADIWSSRAGEEEPAD